MWGGRRIKLKKECYPALRAQLTLSVNWFLISTIGLSSDRQLNKIELLSFLVKEERGGER